MAERFIKTIRNMLQDRVEFNKATWEDMLPIVLNACHNTKHARTEYKPVDAHKDSHATDVKVSLEVKAEALSQT